MTFQEDTTKSWITEYKNLFRDADTKKMIHISFKATLPTASDDIGKSLLELPKLWILWIKVIDTFVKDEDKFHV
jgi:hypothetical protein